MANPVVSSLPQYIKTNADQLVYKAATGAKTLKNIRKQSGIWGKGAINVITPNIVFNGSGCGFNDTSAAEISQRYITTGLMVVNATFCDDQVINTYLEAKFNNGGHISDGDFFNKFIDSYLEGVNSSLDTLIWQGDTGNGDQFDGFLTGITADGVATTLTLSLSGASTPAQVYAAIQSVVLAMPTESLSNGRGVVFLGEDLYNKLVIGLVNANLYHYPAEGVADGLVLPGTNIRAIGVTGLNGTYKVVAGDSDNFVFGTGFGEGDRREDFEFFWSQDDQVWKLIIKFTAGVNTIFPDKIVLGA